jgi:hypothetical protein
LIKKIPINYFYYFNALILKYLATKKTMPPQNIESIVEPILNR